MEVEMDEGTPIAYDALTRGTPVVTRDGASFGAVDHVLSIPSEDLFDGIVVTTSQGIRFVDRDQVLTITDRQVTCDLDAAQAASLPQPDGGPVYTVDALQDTGSSLSDVLGRLFRRPRWHTEGGQGEGRGTDGG
jgi:hypothetical protein